MPKKYAINLVSSEESERGSQASSEEGSLELSDEDRDASPLRSIEGGSESGESSGDDSSDDIPVRVARKPGRPKGSTKGNKNSTKHGAHSAITNSMSAQWCYTLNNPTIAMVRELKSLRPGPQSSVQYHVFQIEVGESGTKHVQGYICFLSRKRFTTVKALLGEKVHLETTRGTPAEASGYCKDPAKRHPDHADFLFEKGDLPKPAPGRRTDIIEIKRLIDEGKHPDAIAGEDEYFGSIRSAYRFYDHYYNSRVEPRRKYPNALVLWGDSGAGKTLATALLRRAYFSPIGSSGSAWFNGYDPRQHRIVVFNEFHGSKCSLTELLQWLDNTPLMVNTKGGLVQFAPELLIFTSNLPPREWYGFDDAEKKLAHPYEALERRLTHVWEYKKTPPNPDIAARAQEKCDDIHGFAFCEKGNPKFHPNYSRFISLGDNIFAIPTMAEDLLPERAEEDPSIFE